jgi:uncharacterized protein (DUF2267 family)
LDGALSGAADSTTSGKGNGTVPDAGVRREKTKIPPNQIRFRVVARGVMSAQHLEVLETTLHKTHEWLAAISDQSHLDTHESYQALRAVLQTLRDRLPTDEAAHLAAQLPLLVRGIFYEGWRPSEVPFKADLEDFLNSVSEKMVTPRPIDPLLLTQQVLGVMNRFLGEGEMEKIRGLLHKKLQVIFSFL